MAKVKISEYSATAGDNTDVNSVNIAEGCAPSGINNAIREVMAALKRFETGADGDSVTVGGQLAVTGTTTTSPAIVASGDTNTGIFFPAADTIAASTGGTERMRIDSSGNVGIGTDAPLDILTVKQTVNGEGPVLALYNDDVTSGSSSQTATISFDFARTGSAAIQRAAAEIRAGKEQEWESSSSTQDGFLSFYTTANTASAERMRITSAGNVAIGGTDVSNAIVTLNKGVYLQSATDNDAIGYSLEINEGTNNRKAVVALSDSTGDMTIGTTASTGVPDIVFLRGGAEKMRVTADGLTFNGDTAAANALDDYEEGTWTPVIADASTGGNASPTAATSAIYTKVGRMVTVQCFFNNVDTTGMTAGNDIHIRGFPFTAASVTGTTLIPGSIIPQQISFSGYLTPALFDNNTYARIAENTTGATADYIIVSELTSGTTDFFLNITYQSA